MFIPLNCSSIIAYQHTFSRSSHFMSWIFLTKIYYILAKSYSPSPNECIMNESYILWSLATWAECHNSFFFVIVCRPTRCSFTIAEEAVFLPKSIYLLVGVSAGLHNSYITDSHNTWVEDGSRPRIDPINSGADWDKRMDQEMCVCVCL